FMKRWLSARGESISTPMHEMKGMDMSTHSSMDMSGDMSGHSLLMPGMLTIKQMDDLKHAEGEDFDRLFLRGMIQHHTGALIMVKELFDKPGAGQDAELFNFTTDVDSGQRAEIKIMENMLKKKPYFPSFHCFPSSQFVSFS
ncbi:MAG: hypothetical protein DMF69_24470, partial [Acidobacteria bacterium]